jgi:hypothetical protein
MKKHKKSLMEQVAHLAPTGTDTEIETEANTTPTGIGTGIETNTAPAGTDHRQAQWKGCCKLAFNLHRRPNDWAQFQVKLQNGYRIPYVDDPQLMPTALELVSNMAAAGVHKWDWLPAPGADDLADPAAWVARRLAERRSEQNAAERDRRLRQKEARAFGQPGPTGNGAINPVHEQQSKHTLDELARRLEFVMAKHQAEHGEFKREWLDHRSDFYINARDGGISNKQAVIMANAIVGRQERRSFDENWKIVMDWLRARRAKPQPAQPGEQEGAAP